MAHIRNQCFFWLEGEPAADLSVFGVHFSRTPKRLTFCFQVLWASELSMSPGKREVCGKIGFNSFAKGY